MIESPTSRARIPVGEEWTGRQSSMQRKRSEQEERRRHGGTPSHDDGRSLGSSRGTDVVE
jgi:hypothetical protein